MLVHMGSDGLACLEDAMTKTSNKTVTNLMTSAMWPPLGHLLNAIDEISAALALESKITDCPHYNIGPLIRYWADELEAGVWPPK